MSEQVERVVCIAHGAFIPCRRDGEHRLTGNPYWVKAVRDYQGSSAEGLTWEPAWERATPTEREAGEVGAVPAAHVHPGEILTVLGDAWIKCSCGERIDLPVSLGRVHRNAADGLWNAHVAAALEPLIAEREVKAWDEGWWKGQNDHDPTVLGYADNPYRAALTPGPHDFDNHGPTDNPDCPGCVAIETREDT